MKTIEQLIEQTQYFVCCDGDWESFCIKFSLINARQSGAKMICGYDFAGRPTVNWVLDETQWQTIPQV